MECITTLEQNTTNNTWEGTSIKSGIVKKFKTLDDYKQYVSSLEDNGTYCPAVTPRYNIKYTEPKKHTTPTGFLEFAPRDPVQQAKYDALSPTWEGVESSMAAVARGEYALDSAEASRQEDRETIQPKPRPVSVWNCVIQ